MLVGSAELRTCALTVVCTLDFVIELANVAPHVAAHAEPAVAIAARLALSAAALEATHERCFAIRVERTALATRAVRRSFSATRDGGHSDEECAGRKKVGPSDAVPSRHAGRISETALRDAY